MKSVGLYLNCDPNWGGTFQYALSILQALSAVQKKQGINLTVVYENTLWEPILEKHGVFKKIHSHPNRFSKNAFFKVWRSIHFPISLWRVISRFFHPTVKVLLKAKCDLWFFPSQDQVSFFGPYQAITSIHDLMHRYENFPEVREKKEFNFRENLYSNICRYSKTILVDSQVGQQQVLESYGEQYQKKIEVLPYIIPYYLGHQKTDHSIFNRLEIPKDYIFYPAQFWKHKNHVNLVKAFEIVKKKYPNLALVLSGGGKNSYEEVLDWVHKLKLTKSVFFVGYVSEAEIVSLYQNALCMAMPTFFGPTNIPPLEALSFGIPVVYSKIYAYQEFLGDSAYFVDPHDPHSIAKGIVDALEKKQSFKSYNFEEKKIQFFKKIEDLCAL